MNFRTSLILIDLYSACGIIGNEVFEMLLSDSYRTEEKNYYRTILKNNFPRGNPIPHSDLNKDYLSRRYQDRHNYNRATKMPFKGLQKRCNQDFRNFVKQRKAQREQKIKDAFARKV